MATIEVKVPDIGDFKDVEVIEVLVKPGDRIEKEQSLITVESDKASMEIPSPAAGVVKDMAVKMGSKVSQGSLVLSLETSAAEKSQPEKSEPEKPQPAKTETSSKPQAAPASPFDFDLLVLGAGPGGYSAAFRAADLG